MSVCKAHLFLILVPMSVSTEEMICTQLHFWLSVVDYNSWKPSLIVKVFHGCKQRNGSLCLQSCNMFAIEEVFPEL